MAEIQRTEQPFSPEEEIRELERKLEEKKHELAAAGNAPQPEKDVFREVMREHVEAMQPATPGAGAPSVSHIPPTSAKPPADTAAASVREDELRLLIERALTRTIADAVDAAYRESPYLLDALHDRLVDEYYDKLIALRKIDAL